MTFHAAIPLRWVDLDAQRHVNNTLALEYVQEARTRMLSIDKRTRSLMDGCIVASHRLHYLREIDYRAAPLDVEVCAAKVGNAKFVLDYLIRQDGEIAVHAQSALCPFDFETDRVRRLTRLEQAGLHAVHQHQEKLHKLDAPALTGGGVPFELYARWGDLDAFGHVNNVRTLDFIQEARIRMSTDLDPTMARAGMSQWHAPTDQPERRWLNVRQDIEYVNQMAWRLEPYTVQTAIAKVGTTSVTFVAEIVDPLAHNQLLTRASTVLVCADHDSRPTSLPPTTRAALESMLVA